MKQFKIPIPLILKCGCGLFRPHDDYPFVSCPRCGFINSGSKEELENAKKEGKLMKTIKWNSLTHEEKEIIMNKYNEIKEEIEEDEFLDDFSMHFY